MRRCASLLACAFAAHAVAGGMREDLDSRIEAWMAEQKCVGASITILQKGKPLYRTHRGFTDFKRTTAPNEKTLYRLASVSKPVTAIASLLAVEQRRFDFTRDIRTYVPSFPDKGSTITGIHLLTHTSGVRHYQPGKPDAAGPKVATCLEGMARFAQDPLLFAPGEKVSYSTHAFTLLGAALEQSYQKSFDQILQEGVMRKAGKDGTILVENPERPLPDTSPLFHKISGEVIPVPVREDNRWKAPGGGMIASSGNLARFFDRFLQGKLVKTGTVAQLLNLVKTPAKNAAGISEGGVVHGGAQQGASSYLIADRKTGIVVVVLTNTSGLQPEPLAQALFQRASQP